MIYLFTWNQLKYLSPISLYIYVCVCADVCAYVLSSFSFLEINKVIKDISDITSNLHIYYIHF